MIHNCCLTGQATGPTRGHSVSPLHPSRSQIRPLLFGRAAGAHSVLSNPAGPRRLDYADLSAAAGHSQAGPDVRGCLAHPNRLNSAYSGYHAGAGRLDRTVYRNRVATLLYRCGHIGPAAVGLARQSGVPLAGRSAHLQPGAGTQRPVAGDLGGMAHLREALSNSRSARGAGANMQRHTATQGDATEPLTGLS
jgi:hypothetical protein